MFSILFIFIYSFAEAGALKQPTGLTATAVSSSQINLTWDTNKGNLDGFIVVRLLPTGQWCQITQMGPNTTSYSDTGSGGCGTLQPSTLYQYRVGSFLGSETLYSSIASTTTLGGSYSAPTVSTGSATSVTSNSATLNGTADPNGASTTAYFQYGMTTGYGSTTAPQNVGSGTTAVAIPGGNVSGLTCNTIYHYRAVGYNGGGTAYGLDRTFTTSACSVTPPTVITDSATGITASSATLNGTVDPNGASTTTYFLYGTTTSYGNSTAFLNVGSGTTEVSIPGGNISGLSCNTTYHYRAVGFNGGGKRYGWDKTFTTSACSVTPPTVITDSATGITTSSATLNGTVDPNGASTTAYFQYGTTTGYGSTTAPQNVGSGTNPVSVSANISGLSSQATYHFRLVATNSGGTRYGANSTFTPVSLSVSITSPSSGSTYTSAQTVTIYASASDNGGVAKVEFYDNGVLKGTDTTNAYTHSWSVTSSNNGTHKWTAKAYDTAGNVAISSAVSLTVSIPTAANPSLVGFLPGIGAVMDVTVAGTEAFMASDLFGLSAVNVDSPTAPTLSGSSNSPFFGSHIATGGSIAGVGGWLPSDGKARFWTIDISIPTDPQIVGELSTSISVGNGGYGFQDIALNSTGTLAAAAMSTSGVWIIDLSNPVAPVKRGTYATSTTAYGIALNHTGTLAYVVESGGTLNILNISNPSQPTLAGSLKLSGRIYRDVAVSGNYAYLLNQQGTIDVVDVSNPSAPVVKGFVMLLGGGYRVSVEGTRAIVLSSQAVYDYLEVFDLSNPTAPVRTGSASAPYGTFKGINLSGGLAYVAATTEGLKIYDIGTISSAATISAVGPSDTALSTVTDTFMPTTIAVGGNLSVVTGTYTPTGMAHLRAVNISIPTNPEVKGELSTSISVGNGGYGFQDIALNSTGTLAAAAMSTSGVWIIDLSNPVAPVKRGTYATSTTAYGIALNHTGTLAYVVESGGTLNILNISNPSQPTLAGSLKLSGRIYRDVAVSGNYAYLLNQQGTIDVVDVSNPSAPVVKGFVTLLAGGYRVSVEGTRAIVLSSSYVTGYDYLEVFDLSNPTAPVRTGSASALYGTFKGINLSGGLAYVAATTEGLKIYDIVTGTPSPKYTVLTVGDAFDVAVKNATAYVADYPATLDIISLQ
jgi:hypothetical protein